jgi:hypothetical protein
MPTASPSSNAGAPRALALRATLCLLAASLLCQTGCVRRRMLIRSNPPGAMVYVDNQPIGVTPCATNFVYYGTREIRLVKAGYETLSISQPIPAPWYQIPPLDFASENLVPQEIQDYRTLSYNLSPQQIVPTNQIVARADQLRASTKQGTPLPTSSTPAYSGGTEEIPAPAGEPMFGPPTAVPPVGPLPPPYAPAGSLPSGGAPLEVVPASP